MDILSSLIALVKNHFDDMWVVYTSIVTIASIVVKFTPTIKDDDALKAVIKFVGKYVALNTTKGSTPSPKI